MAFYVNQQPAFAAAGFTAAAIKARLRVAGRLLPTATHH